MFTIELKMIENHFDELEKRLKELSKSGSTTGYFIEQGEHKGSEDNGQGMLYTDMIALMETGYSGNNMPSRPVIQKAYLKTSPQNPTMERDLTKYLSNIDNKSKKITTDEIHEHFIKELSDEIKSIFGDTSQLESNKPSTIAGKKVTKKDSPLVDTNELREALAYKIDNSKYKLTKTLG